MTFAWPLALLLLSAVPLAGTAMWLLARWHRSGLVRVFSPVLLERVLPASVRRRRAVRDLALLFGFAMAIVAVAEPRFAKQARQIKAKGTDIVVLLDLSRSMDATDVDPSRLVRARREIEDLGRVTEGDRIGLVVFAGGAFARLPLTSDMKALSLVVGETTTDTFDTQGSNLGAAIDAGLELLSRTEDEAGKALLVLSDGETHDPDAALAAAKRAEEARVPVYAMGIGVESAPIPLRRGGFLEYEGELVRTHPDFEILQQVAKETGGAFVESGASSKDLEGLYAELRRTVRAVERETTQHATHDSAFQWPLAAGACGFLIAALLGDGRRLGIVVALLAAGVATSDARAASLTEADAAYRAGDFPKAVQELTALSFEAPGDPEVLERLGAARYRSGDFEGAARAWDAAAANGGGADALYNAGNAHYQAGRLEEAVARYDQLLQAAPDHEAGQHNKQLVQAEIESRRQQKPPPPPKPDDGERQDGEGGEGKEPPSAADGSQKNEDKESKSGSGQEQENPDTPPEPQPGEGQQDGDPQQNPGDGQEPGQEPQPGQGDGQSNGEPTPDLAGEEGQQSSGNQGGSGGEAVPITAAQADRLFDSIEEGTPKTVVRGQPEGKPW